MRRSFWWLSAISLAAAVAVMAATPPPHLPRALAAQQELAAERPGDPAVLNDLGNLLRLAGRLDQAEEAYRQSIAADPERVTARFNLALLLQQRGKMDAALGELREVVARQPGHAWAHYQIGAILESRGENQSATRSYATAFALDPELSFPEVNPHVIENRLLTEALILSQRGAGAIPQAPNTYEDPARIAALLMPPVSSDGEPESAERPAEEEEPVEMEGETEGRARPEEQPAGGGRRPRQGSAVPPRALTEEDLEPGGRNLGQASQAAPGRSSVRGGVRRPSSGRSFAVPGFVPADPQGRELPRVDPQTGRSGGRVVTPPQAPGRRTPTGSRFRPGTTSSGRLDLRLLPGSPAEDRAGEDRTG